MNRRKKKFVGRERVNMFAGQKPKLHNPNVIEGVKLPLLLHG